MQLLGLLPKSILRGGQGVDHHHPLPAGRELEEGHEEGYRLLGQVRLASSGGNRLGCPQVAGHLVQHDQRGLVADQLLPQPRARGDLAPLTSFYQGRVLTVGQLSHDLAPEGVGPEPLVSQSRRGLQVRANDAHYLDRAWSWDDRRVH